VSIDAMGCQKTIARTIVDAGADDVLALKDNHPPLHADVHLWLDTEIARGRLSVAETGEKDHGRIEIRRYALSAQIDWLDAKPDWAGLQTVGRVESTRPSIPQGIGDTTRTECR
jgi:predicted transposase YbfD/YdcC